MDYQNFLKAKVVKPKQFGFIPHSIPGYLFPFQGFLCDWAIRKGKSALLCDCGMGKSIMALVWMHNCLWEGNNKGLVVTPLAVGRQFVQEAKKFGMEARFTQDGRLKDGINVTNYERLENFNPEEITAIDIDESGSIKNYDGKTRQRITKFVQSIPYRLLCSATPAPNDFMELGSSSEVLGEMTRNQMLAMFFVNDGKTTQQWSLKGHAKKRFWQWVASWARACRKPSDFGFGDGKFTLPPLNVIKHVLPSKKMGGFFSEPARTLEEQRAERRNTLKERCEKVAELVPNNESSIIWCHLNDEGDLLEKLIPGAVQVAGKDKDEVKEERLLGFANGQIKTLVTKGKIAGWGLNLQICHNVFYFPSWSHESYYQCIRRCWRFGQEHPVNCHIVTTEAERLVVEGMMRKERQSQELFDGIIRHMNDAIKQTGEKETNYEMELPIWIQ